MRSLKKFFLIVGSVFFSACGDDVTKVYMENAGEMLYAADSARVYYCAESAWATLNGRDGFDGRNCQDGEKGPGCTADSTAKGIVVVCGGDTVGTIVNGKDDSSSVDTLVVSKSELVVIDTVLGLDGSSCTAEGLPDGSGYRIVCGGDSVGVEWFGRKRRQGWCDGRDGLAKVPEGNYSCSEYDCATTAYLNPAFEYGSFWTGVMAKSIVRSR